MNDNGLKEGPFGLAKRAISQAETVRFAMRNGPFQNVKRYVLKRCKYFSVSPNAESRVGGRLSSCRKENHYAADSDVGVDDILEDSVG